MTRGEHLLLPHKHDPLAGLPGGGLLVASMQSRLVPRLSAGDSFWYADGVKGSVSIVLFPLLSGFFLTALLGALEHSRKFLGIAGVLLVGIVCVIVFLTPVQLPPSLRLGFGDEDENAAAGTTTTSEAAGTSTVTSPPGFSITPTVTSTSVLSPASSAPPENAPVSTYPMTSTVGSPAVSATTTEANGVRSP